jgi:hypothetical protein
LGKTYKYDLTICLPTIRLKRIPEFLKSIPPAIGLKHNWQLIMVGPYFTQEIMDLTAPHRNIKIVQDYGSPSRCVQIGASLAEGEIFTWASDDGIFTENSLSECIGLLRSDKNTDAIIVQYREGKDRKGETQDSSYWKPWTHKDQQLPGIPKEYWTAPVGMYYTEDFIALGGLDCRFLHVNMNAHDLAFRFQNSGGKFSLSPGLVLDCDFDNDKPIHTPIERAYWSNDRPLFQKIYSEPFNKKRTVIDFDNWKQVQDVWERFQ